MRRYSLWVVIALNIQAGVKLWLVHRHEVAVCDYPFDDPWYVIASLNGYWGGSYAAGGFARPPAYPLWIAASRMVGIPLRLSTELLLLAAAAALAWALRQAGASRIVAVMIFALVVFQPLSIFVNDFVTADALYAPILLLSAAGMIALLAHPTNRYAAFGTGVTLALLWHTRHEGPIVVVHLLLFGALLALARRRQGQGARAIAREVTVIGCIVGLIIAGTTLCIRTMNYASFGAFADQELALPEFRALNAALLRILPETNVCSVPVTNAMLRHAYAASPTLRTLQPYFDTPEGQQWIDLSTQVQAGPHEMAGGTVPWALLAAIRWGGQGQTAGAMRAFCRRCADEIDTACDAGQLRCTSTALGPLMPLRNCVSHVPSSGRALAAVFWWTGAGFTPHCPAMKVDPAIVDAFDVAANRRRALVSETLYLAGWAIDPRDPVRSVSFRDAYGQTVVFTDQLRARPDLDAAFKSQVSNDSEPMRGAFELAIPLPRNEPPGGVLLFARHSGKIASLTYDELRTVPLRYRLQTGDDAPLEYAIEQRDLLQPSDAGASWGLTLLLRSYGYVVILLGFGCVMAILTLVTLRRRAAVNAVLWNTGLLLLGLTAVRCVVFTVVHTILWPAPAPEARYLYPVASLLPAASLVLIQCTVMALRARMNQPIGSTSVAARAPKAKP